jgi:Flp pilus assembly protein CpaB
MSVGERYEGGSPLRTLEPQGPPKRSLSSRLGLLHVIAIVSGLLAFLLILTWMRSQQDVVEVAVAVEEIRSGNVMSADLIEYQEVPAAGTFGDRMITPEEAGLLEGAVATRQIAPGEPVLDSDLRPVDTPAGLRAMSVPLDINRAVGGVLAVGDRVDVIGFDEVGPHYIATDIEVLDIPGERSGAFGSGASYAVTVAVDDAQALAIARALDFGDLHVLRSTGAPDVLLERLEDLESESSETEPAEGG